MRSKARSRGFTLIEMAVTVAIAAVITVLAYTAFYRDKPRATLASAASELQSLLHQARQSALGSGTPVAVLLYPAYSPPSTAGQSTGYVVIYQDGCYDFFTATQPTCPGFSYAAYAYNAATLTAGPSSVVIDTMTLPHGVLVGPAVGMGAGAVLPAPLATIPVNVACSFCDALGGAIRFDAAGKATFYSHANPTTPLNVAGGSISLGYDPRVTDATGQRTILIMSVSGAVQVLNNG